MKLSLIAGLAAVAFAGAALAQEPAPPPGAGAGPSPEMMAARQAMRQACAADFQSLCEGKAGREAMMCLRDNADKVSQGCKDAIAKMPRRAPPPAAPQ
ncbi:MAG TPA: hypothetical protein VLI41_11775 [Phenylobacterium sp.]|uniref:hypothetical protein n=1 Tax=Phenylobacterium sp. TaxID=1871053 RepID=UPI002C79588D|nr:hypothetical protein [Phenylobacterium sp.]HSV03871.1 hypothetical protein [Phenylobacterium sp.]